MTAKMATMLGNVTLAAPPAHKIDLIIVEKIKGFPLKAKSFLNIATYKKVKGGGGSINPPPLVPRLGYDCVYVQANN